MVKKEAIFPNKHCLWVAILLTSSTFFSCNKQPTNLDPIELEVIKEINYNDLKSSQIYKNLGDWIVCNGVINSHFQIYEIYQGLLVDIDLNNYSSFEYDKVGKGPGEYQRAMYSSFSDSSLYIADQNGKLIAHTPYKDTLIREFRISPMPMSFFIHNDEVYLNHLIKNEFIFKYNLTDPTVVDSFETFRLESGSKNVLAEWGRISIQKNVMVFIPTYLDHIWLFNFAEQSWQKQKYPFGVSHKVAIESGSSDNRTIKRPDIENSFALANIALQNNNYIVLNNFQRVTENEATTVYLSIISSDMVYKGSIKINGAATKHFVVADNGRIAWVTTEGVFISDESILNL